MDWDTLRKLVDGWHDAAKEIPGYPDTTIDGDGPTLLLMLNRTKEGDLRLEVIAARDWISTISPSELLKPEDVKAANKPTIPTASVTIKG